MNDIGWVFYSTRHAFVMVSRRFPKENAGLIFILVRNKKVEYFIRIKTYKLLFSNFRFKVVSISYTVEFRSYQCYVSSVCKSKKWIVWFCPNVYVAEKRKKDVEILDLVESGLLHRVIIVRWTCIVKSMKIGVL